MHIVILKENKNYFENAIHWNVLDQGLHPASTCTVGLFTIAGNNTYIMMFGGVVFDQQTNNFIACTLINVSALASEEYIQSLKVNDTYSIALVRWDTNGTVFNLADVSLHVYSQVAGWLLFCGLS